MAELSTFSKFIRRKLNALGWDVMRYDPLSHPRATKLHQLKTRNIDVVLDVGANTGQYARWLREVGYRGKIHSFEPLASAFAELSASADTDANWTTHHLALGEEAGELEVHIAESSASSSLLPTSCEAKHLRHAAKTVATEPTRVERLDAVFADLCPQGSHVLLKIDTQGYEDRVLAGATHSLTEIELVHLEMSFSPLYEGQVLFNDLYALLQRHGYRLATLGGGWSAPETGDLMQIDGLFQR